MNLSFPSELKPPELLHMDKQTANQILSSLDRSANTIDELSNAGKIDPKVAAEISANIDRAADKIEIAAFGEKNLAVRQAKVLQRDPDEKFMDTYDNPNKVLQSDADEKFMHKTEPSFNSKAMDTFDADRSSTVSDRDEYQVRDLSEHADPTKKQPSWAKGPAGKSTKQGSTGKTWAR